MKLLEKLRTNRAIRIVTLVLLTLIVPYLTIPILLVWWFFKSGLSIKTKIVVASVLAVVAFSLIVMGVRAYNNDIEPHLTIIEPQSDIHVQVSNLTIKGIFDPIDRKVWINGKQIKTNEGNFDTEAELKEGKNVIKVSAGNWKRTIVNLVVYRELTEEEKAAKITSTPMPTLSEKQQEVVTTITKTQQPTVESQKIATLNTPTTIPTKTISKSFAEKELSEESVRAEISKLSFGRSMAGQDIESVELIDNLGTDNPLDDKIVALTYNPKSIWDAKDLVKKTTDTTLALSEGLFKHPKVSLIRVFTKTVFTDSYGKEDTENAVKIELKRATVDKIDWVNFKIMVLVDYNKLLDVADFVWIHPSIKKAL